MTWEWNNNFSWFSFLHIPVKYICIKVKTDRGQLTFPKAHEHRTDTIGWYSSWKSEPRYMQSIQKIHKTILYDQLGTHKKPETRNLQYFLLWLKNTWLPTGFMFYFIKAQVLSILRNVLMFSSLGIMSRFFVLTYSLLLRSIALGNWLLKIFRRLLYSLFYFYFVLHL